jgi:hypothetical protein
MEPHFPRLKILATLMVLVMSTACGPKVADSPGDVVGTAVAQAAFELMTQTAAASSPTPRPPTDTPTSMWTETATIAPTDTEPPPMPRTVTFANCWLGGPGPSYVLEVHIPVGKAVEIIGIGSIPGWYILRDWKFQRPCWTQASDLNIDPRTDLSVFPVMTPGVPGPGQ